MCRYDCGEKDDDEYYDDERPAPDAPVYMTFAMYEATLEQVQKQAFAAGQADALRRIKKIVDVESFMKFMNYATTGVDDDDVDSD